MRVPKTLAKLFLSLLIVTSPAVAQTDATEVTIESSVYRPGKLQPTEDRLSNLKLPPGFKITKFAEGLGKPRMMAVAADGSVYVTRREPGDCWLLKDEDGDGQAEVRKKVAEKKEMHGVHVDGNKVYLTTIKEVFTAQRRPDGSLGPLSQIMSDLPDGGQHPNRTLATGPDGKLYLSVGSTCNACPEPNPENATILQANADGTGRKIYASGLRNTIGFAWHPLSKEMFGMDHGIDWLGDNEQKEELNRIVADTRYGWPYIYADGQVNPSDVPPEPYSVEEWREMSKEPELLLPAHSAPMQMLFYTGEQFPEEYKNDLFLALHGSWNRKPPSGYQVVRVRFQEGRPVEWEPFVEGFLVQEEGEYKQFGRPCGLVQLPDGSLLLGDDDHGAIYRISYSADS